MASLERTASPRFKSPLPSQELVDLYTPTPEDHPFAHRQTSSPVPQFFVLVLLKAFPRLGYFPKLAEVPPALLTHLRGGLPLHPTAAEQELASRPLNRSRRAIRASLHVTVYAHAARHLAVRAVYEAARTMDNPADLIHVALEPVSKERDEFPAFSTLDRLGWRVWTLVNRRFFGSVFQRLSGVDQEPLDALLTPDPRLRRSPYNRLKQVPKRPTLTHLQEGLDPLTWWRSLGAVDPLLNGLPPLKRNHFALEAKALDAAEMLAGEDQHGIGEEGLLNGGPAGIGECDEVDASDDGAKGGFSRSNDEYHKSLSCGDNTRSILILGCTHSQ